MKLSEFGEDRLLAELLPTFSRTKSVILGAGDDCAVVRFPAKGNLQLLKTDCIVEGIHFTASKPAELIGWKAMARPLSDFAAMSGVPQFALVSLIVHSKTELAWTKRLYQGLERAARAFDVTIVGGETSRTTGPAVISVSVTGFVEKGRWVTRNGGKPKDELFVTGRLGGSLRVKHLKFTPRINEARWLTENFSIHAMLDLSDGLGADLPRLAHASKLGFEIDEKAVPRERGCTLGDALTNGEDYELLFAVAPRVSEELKRRWRRRWRLGLARIGRLTRRKVLPEKWPSGYVHFK